MCVCVVCANDAVAVCVGCSAQEYFEIVNRVQQQQQQQQ